LFYCSVDPVHRAGREQTNLPHSSIPSATSCVQSPGNRAILITVITTIIPIIIIQGIPPPIRADSIVAYATLLRKTEASIHRSIVIERSRGSVPTQIMRPDHMSISPIHLHRHTLDECPLRYEEHGTEHGFLRARLVTGSLLVVTISKVKRNSLDKELFPGKTS